MKTSTYRRVSWLSILLAALSIGLPQTLDAQSTSGEGAVATPAASGQLKTLAVVAGARYEKLMSDLTFLGSMAGQADSGQMAEAMINQFTMGKGPNAIDKSKPWGLIVQTDGAGFYPVVCLPVSKPDDVLEVAKAYGAEVKDGQNGVKELVLPNQKTLYVKPENGVVFISVAAASLSRLPGNPQDILSRMVADYDLSAAVAVKNIPEMYRQFAISAMQAGMQQGMRKLPNETDEQFADRQRLAQAQIGQMTRMINEIDTIKVGWAVDAQQKRTYLDFTYQFVPGSKMAQQIASYAEPRTDFAGFFQPDAAATLVVSTKADPKLMAEDLAQMESMMRNSREQVNREIDKNVSDAEAREALKAALADWFDAVDATVKEGRIDGGAALHLSADSLTLVAGGHVKDPAKVESGLKKLETAAKKSPKFPGIKWNAETHAGVNFHTMTIPGPPADKAPHKLLGDEVNVAVGIGPDSTYLAVGRDNIDAVNKAIDASAAAKGKAVPPFELAISLGPIMEVAAAQAKDDRHRELFQSVADMLKSQAQGRDHIRAVGKIVPNGLQYRLEAEEGAMRAIGAAAAQVQRQRLQANR